MGDVVGRPCCQDRADLLAFLIFLLAAQNHAVSFRQAALDLRQFRSLETDLDRALVDAIVAVEDVNRLPIALEDKRFHGDGEHVLYVVEFQLGVGIHAGIDRKILVFDIDLRLHGSGFEVDIAGKANHLAGKRAAQGIDPNLQLVANLDVPHGIFRHRQAQPQQAALGEPHDGQSLIIGVRCRTESTLRYRHSARR